MGVRETAADAAIWCKTQPARGRKEKEGARKIARRGGWRARRRARSTHLDSHGGVVDVRLARDHLCGFRGCGRVRGGRRMCAPEGHHARASPRFGANSRGIGLQHTRVFYRHRDATRRGFDAPSDSIRRPAPPASARAPHPSSRLRGRRAGETMGKAKADAEPKVPKCPPGMDPEYFAMTLVRLGRRRVRSCRILVFGTVASRALRLVRSPNDDPAGPLPEPSRSPLLSRSPARTRAGRPDACEQRAEEAE
jgi:hypothetical protein